MLLPVLFRCASFDCLEFTDKIANIVKAAVKGDLRDRLFGMNKKCTGLFQPVSDQILDGGDACNLPEKAAEILAVAGNGICQLLQGDGIPIVLFHVGNDGFVAFDLPGIGLRHEVLRRQKHLVSGH